MDPYDEYNQAMHVAESQLQTELCDKYNCQVSIDCVRDVIYLRTRNRWSQELEDKLVQAYLNGEPVNVFEFGVTAITQKALAQMCGCSDVE